MRFENGKYYFIKDSNKYNLHLETIKDVTENSFTFITKCKPDWDLIEKNSTVAIVVKNGKHIGIIGGKFESPSGIDEYFISVTGWTIDDELNEIPFDLNLQVDKNENEYNISFIHNLEKKEIELYVNDKKASLNYKGDIIDYSNSYLWVGCGHGFPKYYKDHQWMYTGDIFFIGIYKTNLNKNQIDKIINDDSLSASTDKNLKPAFVTNFKTYTPYKVKDDTGYGNNLIINGFEYC